jgi:DNA-binding Lrp family transcriptional regulator
MENTNYITVQGWMINELNLKGNELLLYAIIYGFSQSGQGEYFGSQRYISKAMKISLPTVNKLINTLIEKGLIFKTKESHYQAIYNKEVLKKVKQGVKETLTVGVKESLTVGVKETLTNKYNTNYNTNYNNKDKELTDFLLLEVKKRYPFVKDKTEKQLISNYEEMNKLNRIDGYDYETISLVIRFSQYDEFWKRNIRSVDKLRIKFETLLIQAQSKIKEYQDNKIIKI